MSDEQLLCRHPTPWRAEPITPNSAHTLAWVDAQGDVVLISGNIALDFRDGTGDYALRAVNAHADLVRACERTVNLLESRGLPEFYLPAAERDPLTILRATLEAAKGA